MDTGIIIGIISVFLAIISILLAIAFKLIGYINKRRKLLKSIYNVKWRSTAKLKPKELMGERGSPKTGFRDYYSSRPEYDLLLAKIESRENVLIVGHPLAGKTRAAYQAFKGLSKTHDVISIELKTITEEEGGKIADAVNIPWANVKFNHTVGSIFLPLREMEIRFGKCEREEKSILRAIKLLFDSGIYRAKQFFPHEWIKIVCRKKYGLEGEEYDWNKWRERLKEKEFLNLEADGVLVDEVYLEYLVKLETEQTELQVLEEMSGVFADIPEAIFLLGNKAYEFGTVKLEKAEFMKIAIEAYEEALKVFTESECPKIFPVLELDLKSLRDFCGGA